MVDKTIRRPTSNKEYFHSLSHIALAELLYGFCENSERCYFCPLNKIVCGGQTSLDDWIEWLDKPLEKGVEI